MNPPSPAPELRDIHLPPPPSWWPPAPGWWLLAVLVVASLVVVLRWLMRRRRERRWRMSIQAELERIATAHEAQPDAVQLAMQVSQLLRRASRLIEPQAAALRDDEWLDFLDRQLPPARITDAPFRSGAGRLLIDAPYRRAGDPAAAMFDSRALLDLARGWLAHVLRRRPSHV